MAETLERIPVEELAELDVNFEKWKANHRLDPVATVFEIRHGQVEAETARRQFIAGLVSRTALVNMTNADTRWDGDSVYLPEADFGFGRTQADFAPGFDQAIDMYPYSIDPNFCRHNSVRIVAYPDEGMVDNRPGNLVTARRGDPRSQHGGDFPHIVADKYAEPENSPHVSQLIPVIVIEERDELGAGEVQMVSMAWANRETLAAIAQHPEHNYHFYSRSDGEVVQKGREDEAKALQVVKAELATPDHWPGLQLTVTGPDPREEHARCHAGNPNGCYERDGEHLVA